MQHYRTHDRAHGAAGGAGSQTSSTATTTQGASTSRANNPLTESRRASISHQTYPSHHIHTEDEDLEDADDDDERALTAEEAIMYQQRRMSAPEVRVKRRSLDWSGDAVGGGSNTGSTVGRHHEHADRQHDHGLQYISTSSSSGFNTAAASRNASVGSFDGATRSALGSLNLDHASRTGGGGDSTGSGITTTGAVGPEIATAMSPSNALNQLATAAVGGLTKAH